MLSETRRPCAKGEDQPSGHRRPGFAPGERATQLTFAMHEALACDGVTEIECDKLIAETLSEVVCAKPPSTGRAPSAVRRARAFLHDALADKITLDDPRLARWGAIVRG